MLEPNGPESHPYLGVHDENHQLNYYQSAPLPALSESYRVSINGAEQGPMSAVQVRTLAQGGQLKPTDPVSYNGQQWVPAVNAPGIFSDKSFTTAAVLSFFLGGLGVDRFYLGHTGLGIAKLLVGWMTFGIWPLIDFILILLRKVPDSDGRPLR